MNLEGGQDQCHISFRSMIPSFVCDVTEVEMCFAVVLSFAWITGTTLLEVGAVRFLSKVLFQKAYGADIQSKSCFEWDGIEIKEACY